MQISDGCLTVSYVATLPFGPLQGSAVGSGRFVDFVSF